MIRLGRHVDAMLWTYVALLVLTCWPYLLWRMTQ